MRAGDFGIAIFRIILSVILGFIVVVFSFVAYNYIDFIVNKYKIIKSQVKSDNQTDLLKQTSQIGNSNSLNNKDSKNKCNNQSNFSEQLFQIDISTRLKEFINVILKDYFYLLLIVSFLIGEFFRLIGEFLLAYFYRFTDCSIEKISLYTFYDVNRNENSFSRGDLVKAFETNNPLLNVSEMLYSLATCFGGAVVFFFLFNLSGLFVINSLYKSYTSDISIFLFFLFCIFSPVLSSIMKKIDRIENMLDKLSLKFKKFSKNLPNIFFIPGILIVIILQIFIVDLLFRVPIVGLFLFLFFIVLFLLIWTRKYQNRIFTYYLIYFYFYFLLFLLPYYVNFYKGLFNHCNEKFYELVLYYLIFYFFVFYFTPLILHYLRLKYYDFVLLIINIHISFILVAYFYMQINEIKFSILNLLWVSHLLSPLFLLLSFIFNTQANEIIFNILQNKKNNAHDNKAMSA